MKISGFQKYISTKVGIEKHHHIEKNMKKKKKELNGGRWSGGGTKKIFVNRSGVCTTARSLRRV